MPNNKIKKLRTKLGLTQKQLADAVGTSQQQIQRVESGVVSAKLELAAKISSALNTPVEKVFIGYKTAASSAKRRNLSSAEAKFDQKTQENFEKAGVDISVYDWTYIVKLTNGNTYYYPVSKQTHERLFRLSQDYTEMSFFVFYSQEKCIVLNPRFITYSRHTFDFGEAQGSKIEGCTVNIYFNHEKEPEVFIADTYAKDDSDIDAELGDFQNLIFFAENCRIEDESAFMFQDSDGEYVHLNPIHIALMEIPLEGVEYQYALSKLEE